MQEKITEAYDRDKIDALVDALFHIRNKCFDTHPRAQQEFREEIEARAADVAITSRAQREETLKIPIFSLTQSQLEKFQDEIELKHE